MGNDNETKDVKNNANHLSKSPTEELENLRKMIDASYVPKTHYVPDKKDDLQAIDKSVNSLNNKTESEIRKNNTPKPDVTDIPAETKSGIQISRDNLNKPLTNTDYLRTSKSTVRRNKPQKKSNPVLTVILRVFLVIFTIVLLAALSAYSIAMIITHGPSKSARNAFVLNAKQYASTEWIPELVLKKNVIDEIIAQSDEKTVEQLNISNYIEQTKATLAEIYPTSSSDSSKDDGMVIQTVHKQGFKAYLLFIKDPSRIFTGAADPAKTTVFDFAEQSGCLAAVNAAFSCGGMTYSDGQAVSSDITDGAFVGFDTDNKLIVCENLTPEKAAELRIRDGVTVGENDILIDSYDGALKINFYNSDISTGPRSAIAQCADGTVIFFVTDGAPGATKNDIIDIISEYGAVNAAMLEGGESSILYYRNFISKFNLNPENLNRYQRGGMVNDAEPKNHSAYFAVRGN